MINERMIEGRECAKERANHKQETQIATSKWNRIRKSHQSKQQKANFDKSKQQQQNSEFELKNLLNKLIKNTNQTETK